jgi:hypothetical protein
MLLQDVRQNPLPWQQQKQQQQQQQQQPQESPLDAAYDCD